MRVESPLLKRFCCCIPLRWGLLGWGYFNAVINILYFIYLVYAFIHNVHYITVAIVLAILGIEIAFNIVLVVGCHKKSVKLLKVSYINCIVFLVLTLLAFSLLTFVEMMQMYNNYRGNWAPSTIAYRVLFELAPVVTNMFVQVYVILLINSEMIKLRHQSVEMQFVNHAAEGEVRCVRADADIADKHIAERAEVVV